MPMKKADLVGGEPRPEEPFVAAQESAPMPELHGRRPVPSESGDPHVHHLLGIRQAHMVTLATGATGFNKDLAHQVMTEIDAKLAEMGYEVG